ncbi:MAG TPA: hypothetical protein ENK54_00830 [Thiotrichales bacterium]|nr:hypothetical protein [Thiotrichales bacterium]
MATLLKGPDERALEEEFQKGLVAWRRRDYETALASFHFCEQQAEEHNPRLNLYRSWLGRVLIEQGDSAGVELCRCGAYFEQEDPQVFYNLALVERRLGNRAELVNALRRGLRIAPQDPRLRQLQQEIGIRRPPVFRRLDRDHPLNRWLGLLRHRFSRRLA